MIDKACHRQRLYFKARQQGYVGLVSKLSELMRKTFLCCQAKSPQLEHRSDTMGGSILSWSSVKAVFAHCPELSEADRATELFPSLAKLLILYY